MIKELWAQVSGKVKAIVGALLGIAGFLFFALRKKSSIKELLEQELEKVKSQMEIAKSDETISQNKDKIKELQEKEQQIRAKVQALNSGAISEKDLTPEELDKFFKSRGF